MNSPRTKYGVVAKALHWLIALAIVGMLALGWMMGADFIPNGPTKFALYQWHKSIGITILALSLLRLIWRIMNPPPPPPADLQRWEVLAAKTTHYTFYILMIGLPLVGWMIVSASPYKTQLYGVVPLPNLPIIPDLENKSTAKDFFEGTHGLMAYIMAALLVLHVGAAGKHHLINRDDVLLRMAPEFLGGILNKIRGSR